MRKKALAVISFGTTDPAARTAITKIESYLSASHLEYDFFRAFTSKTVIRKIAETENICILTPSDLLEQLALQGYRDVICQSIHMIPGHEYDKLCAQIHSFAHRFDTLQIGTPLLYQEADYTACCNLLLKHILPLDREEAFVFMGHGTDHFANAAYSQMENMFRYLGGERIYVGTVEGFPGISYIIQRLSEKKVRKVTLAPLMIVAGEHAKNDMAGMSSESWKSILEQHGYSVEVQMKGLGEYPEIAALFDAHVPVVCDAVF